MFRTVFSATLATMLSGSVYAQDAGLAYMNPLPQAAPVAPMPAGVGIAAPAVATPVAPLAPVVTSVPGTVTYQTPSTATSQLLAQSDSRGFLQSDHAFDGFVGPVSNPIFAKDPRSLTEARALFIQNTIPGNHPLGGGDFQVYALQLRIALTERLTLIADKDGIASLNAGALPQQTGLLNLAAGLKYTFLRDVENQTLAAAGFMFEPQTGYSNVFQGHGDGLMTIFGTFGKEFGCKNHFIGNIGYIFPMDSAENSSLIYSQLHIDRQIFGWLYPLAELNWYHWVSGGRRGLPPALGEGDGLLNLGTSGVAGNDLVTVAVGMKAVISQSIQAGVVYEFPISNRKDLLNNRLIAELVLRY